MATSDYHGQPRTVSDDVGQAAGRYLLAIHLLSTDDERVSTGALQGYLGVSPASVTEMIGRLDDDSLVAHEKHQGVELTPEGEPIANRLAWRYCVVSDFFESVLDTALDTETAYEIGFLLPEDGLLRLGELLGHPCTTECQGTVQSYDGCLRRA